MRLLFIVLVAVAALTLAGLGAFKWWRASQFPAASSEIVLLTEDVRNRLTQLRAEDKFQPNSYPPLGYTGMATPEDKAEAVSAVNDVIDGVLASPQGSVSATKASDLIGEHMAQLQALETEDRERVMGYMIEIWYILGFKGATGRFAYGPAFRVPSGYSEPLPPGWVSPTQPRPIG